jgi:hypothetical protein
MAFNLIIDYNGSTTFTYRPYSYIGNIMFNTITCETKLNSFVYTTIEYFLKDKVFN